MTINYQVLRAKEQNFETNLSTDFKLRIHRSISWVARAQSLYDDEDLKFICYWIAFNASYAKQVGFEAHLHSDRDLHIEFFNKLNALDRDRRIYGTIWDEFSDKVRNLMVNKYIFKPFWDFNAGLITEQEMNEKFTTSNNTFLRAFQRVETGRVLSLIFSRLYLLRNQLIHGGATHKSSKNREQVVTGSGLLGALVPIFVDIMLDHPEEEWGDPYFPVIEE